MNTAIVQLAEATRALLSAKSEDLQLTRGVLLRFGHWPMSHPNRYLR